MDMVERNPCHELGCPVACCRNIYSDYAVGEEWFKKAFPEAIKVGSSEELEGKKDPRRQNVYYYPHSGWIHFTVNGPCPNLDGNLNCRIHEERFFPNLCRKMIPDSDDCHDIQKRQAVLSAINEKSEPASKAELLRIIDEVNT